MGPTLFRLVSEPPDSDTDAATARSRPEGGADGGSAALALVAPVLRRVWGFDALRPLQAEAIAASSAGRDRLGGLPTGGGTSLGYQAPASASGGLTLVDSP